MVKILFTGVGRRVELMQAFRQAALQLGIELKLYGADMAGTAPALTYCDFTRKVCGMGEPEYIGQLLEICAKDHIELLIPTIDTDLLILSKNVGEFEKVGTRVLISKPEKIAVCRDKNYTADFFESCGLKAPRTYKDYKKYSGEYPCFIKPKDGSSSINAFKVNDLEELEVYAEKIGDYIVQPYIEGTEYTIDIFCDFDGNPIYITPRERVAVRAGEVLKTKICMDDRMIQESRQLIEKFKPCGPMAVQLIRQDIKIRVLGLEEFVDDIIVTDELGGVQFRKPNDISFRIMQCRWRVPFEQMVYIGDNLGKDFQAPRQLGMRGIYLMNEEGLYNSKEQADGILETVVGINGVKEAFLNWRK